MKRPIFVNIQKQLLSPEDFLNLSPKEKSAIQSVRFIHPELHKRDFGRFEVTFRYVVRNERRITKFTKEGFGVTD